MHTQLHNAGADGLARVIALHCSGAGGRQWAHFAATIGDDYQVLTPEHYGSEASGPWTGEHAFTIADEAARTLNLIDGNSRRVHLIGHSYGGGVALHVALARPHKIASMALYEPSAFHLLRQLGEPGYRGFTEIADVAQRFSEGVITGDYLGAVARFVDYWNGVGAWDAMRPSAQKSLIDWAPKGPLDFRALLEDRTPADAYGRLRFPVLIMRGQYAPLPTRVIAEGLADLLPTSQTVVIEAAGHMGPLTHAPIVSKWLVEHIAAVDRAGIRPHRLAASRQIAFSPKPSWCPS
jgi:pimeloyl-ACP methyl ester carboxylesterase